MKLCKFFIISSFILLLFGCQEEISYRISVYSGNTLCKITHTTTDHLQVNAFCNGIFSTNFYVDTKSHNNATDKVMIERIDGNDTIKYEFYSCVRPAVMYNGKIYSVTDLFKAESEKLDLPYDSLYQNCNVKYMLPGDSIIVLK